MNSEWENKFGTIDETDEKDTILNDIFLKSDMPDIDNQNDVLQIPMLSIDLDEVDGEARSKAQFIIERLAGYYIDKKYIENHPYILPKIAQEVDNIRRLLKMLSINEKAQDSLITSITTSIGKSSLYSSLTSLQTSMLNMQNQLNTFTESLESIFKEMQANTEETFEQKDKEVSSDGTIISGGTRDFISQMHKYISGEVTSQVSNDDSKLDTLHNLPQT